MSDMVKVASEDWESGADGKPMSGRGARLGLIAALVLFARGAHGQTEDEEPTTILELGGAGQWGLDRGSGFGPSAAIEVTPIENWLEIEAGITPLFSKGQTEWDSDIVFKKPFTLSDSVEFMPGVGPEWVHRSGGGKPADALAGEAVLDFMFWPGPERRFGWYLEPGYEHDFGRGHEQSLGVTVGLLISIP
jgi:hypothetical protein